MTPARPRSTARAKDRARRKPRLVVTAGPTREYIDPVRYLTNESSGRMGFDVAAEAVRAGFAVTLVAGPVALETPAGVQRVDVVSARDMLAATRAAFREADALVMAAAVADWRPRRRHRGKWRKVVGGDDTATLDLVKNPDILATVARSKGARLVIGFALETGDGKQRALGKLRRKGADYIVLNGPSALNAERTSVTIFDREGNAQEIARKAKREVARALVDLAVRWTTVDASVPTSAR